MILSLIKIKFDFYLQMFDFTFLSKFIVVIFISLINFNIFKTHSFATAFSLSTYNCQKLLRLLKKLRKLYEILMNKFIK
jgi:hypothetical protein